MVFPKNPKTLKYINCNNDEIKYVSLVKNETREDFVEDVITNLNLLDSDLVVEVIVYTDTARAERLKSSMTSRLED
jgi:hypothetical protein